MNKALLGLNIVLLLAVGSLFFLFFKYKKDDIHKVEETTKAASTPFKIAYFEMDSLEHQYDYLKEVNTYLRGIDEKNGKYLRSQQEAFQNKVKEYQQKGPSLSQAQQSQYEQELMQMRNSLQSEQEEKSQQMNAESIRKLQEVKSKIRGFLKDYCKEKGYAYVFASSEEDYFYYKDTLRDVTRDIISLLNADYRKSKQK